MPDGHASLPNKPNQENPRSLDEERHRSRVELAEAHSGQLEAILCCKNISTRPYATHKERTFEYKRPHKKESMCFEISI